MDLLIGGEERAEKIMLDNWKKADWDKIRQGLESSVWPTTEDGTSAETAWKLLREVLDKLKAENVPKSEFRARKSDWMTGELLREIRKKEIVEESKDRWRDSRV